MTLRIYNTLTRTKEEFKPLDPKNVRMYVCGPTVYDFAHIGNARPAIVFDVLFRLLRHLYGPDHVTYVRNITDVDDKINSRALRDYPGVPLNDAIRKVTETTYDQYQKDVTALGCLPPTHQPRATEHIQGMIDMIRVLINNGHAYEAAGEVLFNVAAMADYGKLSGRKLEDQQAGARIAVEAHKKNPGDFVLWKQSSPEEPGWESPWGRGRPGWHIECSVMSNSELWERQLKEGRLSGEGLKHPHLFDIHGGGLDLIFPHHENEIAQSRCAHGTSVMANYWMHNGFLQVEGQKMSKSLGNFYTIQQLLARNDFGSNMWHGKVLRLSMLMTHYRQPIDWTVDRLVEARLHLNNWITASAGYSGKAQVDREIIAALADDIDSAKLLELLHTQYKAARSRQNPSACASLAASLDFLGLWQGETALDVLSHGYSVRSEDVDYVLLEGLLSARLEARKAKEWKRSDEIRDELGTMGIQIKDVKDPVTGEMKTEWEVKR